MSKASSVVGLLKRLETRLSSFSDGPEKLELLSAIALHKIHSASQLSTLHRILSFLCAFPQDAAVHRAAQAALAAMPGRVLALKKSEQRLLEDSGIVHAKVRFTYAFENARWLAGQPGTEIDWANFPEPHRLDRMLKHLGSTAELQNFMEGSELSTPEWVGAARGNAASDLGWVMQQLRQLDPRLCAELFELAEVPIVWTPQQASTTFTRQNLPTQYRTGMRRLNQPIAEHIQQTLPIRLLRGKAAQQAIAVVQSGSLVRQREVYAMRYANPREVYLADLGEGTALLVIGAEPAHRLSLEANYGYMILANGRPFGYGGFTPLFAQSNTGINVFPEYRGSEAAFLYAQVLRVAHHLFGSRHFLVNPYQVGQDNDEALKSGAFWFYYRLGFRPLNPEIASLAEAEFGRIKSEKGYRTPISKLKQLASGDIHLELPGARTDDLFDERWLAMLAQGATELIAKVGPDRRKALQQLASDVAHSLGIKTTPSRAEERRAFVNFAPLIGQLNLADWTAAECQSLVKLMRAKGAPTEREFAVLLKEHQRLRMELEQVCRQRG